MVRAIDRRAMGSLSLGHLAADLAQGAVPALLIFLKPVLHLTYTTTAAGVLVATLTSSVAQPWFGRLADRGRASRLMWSGVAAAGGGLAVAAVSPDYALLLVLIGVSGFGVAAFHPEAMKLADHASGGRRASGMAVFQTGGSIGFALGPLLVSATIGPLGLHGGLLLVVPGALVAALLLREHGYLARLGGSPERRQRRATGPDRKEAFWLLLTAIAFRSVAFYGLFTFVPLWEVANGHSRSYGNLLLSLVLATGILSTLGAGPVADRFGGRLVLAGSLLVTPGLVLVYVLVGGVLGIVAVCAAGAAIVSTYAVTTVLSQEYLPSRIATAAGMSVGFATGLGGVAAVLLGAIADAVDLRAALLVTAAGPVLGVVASLLLPRDHGVHRAPLAVAAEP